MAVSFTPIEGIETNESRSPEEIHNEIINAEKEGITSLILPQILEEQLIDSKTLKDFIGKKLAGILVDWLLLELNDEFYVISIRNQQETNYRANKLLQLLNEPHASSANPFTDPLFDTGFDLDSFLDE